MCGDDPHGSMSRGIPSPAKAAEAATRAKARARAGWLTVEQAAEVVRRPVATVQRWIAAGELVVTVADHRRHVRREQVTALARRRAAFARVSP